MRLSTNPVLWILQGFLALFYGLASGAPKLLLPQAMLGMPLPLPDAFVRFVGIAEVLGALGLILPGLTRIRSGLTPLAACGLVIVTLSGAVYQLAGGQPANALFALVMALIVGFVAYGRWRLLPRLHPGCATSPSGLPLSYAQRGSDGLVGRACGRGPGPGNAGARGIDGLLRVGVASAGTRDARHA